MILEFSKPKAINLTDISKSIGREPKNKYAFRYIQGNTLDFGYGASSNYNKF